MIPGSFARVLAERRTPASLHDAERALLSPEIGRVRSPSPEGAGDQK